MWTYKEDLYNKKWFPIVFDGLFTTVLTFYRFSGQSAAEMNKYRLLWQSPLDDVELVTSKYYSNFFCKRFFRVYNKCTTKGIFLLHHHSKENTVKYI
jgi:hypothetical protein